MQRESVPVNLLRSTGQHVFAKRMQIDHRGNRHDQATGPAEQVEHDCGVDGVLGERIDPETGIPRTVENEDYAAALLTFESGAVGVVETSRIAQGRKMDIGFEITCDRGTLVWDGERLNELRIYDAGQPAIGQGFRTLLANAAHPGYAGFLPAPGHQLGFNDLKTIELNAFLTGIAAGTSAVPDLENAAQVSRICDAILASSASDQAVTYPGTTESLPQ